MSGFIFDFFWFFISFMIDKLMKIQRILRVLGTTSGLFCGDCRASVHYEDKYNSKVNVSWLVFIG
jgi:hypothetical protein